MARVVADSSSLIHLEEIGPLALLQGLLYKAKRNGLIAAVRPVLDALLATGFRLSPRLYRTLLSAAGEAE